MQNNANKYSANNQKEVNMPRDTDDILRIKTSPITYQILVSMSGRMISPRELSLNAAIQVEQQCWNEFYIPMTEPGDHDTLNMLHDALFLPAKRMN